MAAWLIGGALAGAGAAAAAGWHAMSPVSQLYGETFVGAAPGARELALTFDDGPNDPWTPRLLDVLARRQVRATFFMIGNYVSQKPDLARAVAQAGHEIGNHTQTHPNLAYCSAARIARELAECESALRDVIGDHAPFFRPPFGGRRPAVLRAAAHAGMKTIMWRASAFDWELPSAEAIVAKVVSQVRGGEVILMHDGSHRGMGWDRSRTAAAADELIRRYAGEGYRFVTVGEMMQGGSQQSAVGHHL
jgi:peptidoglycan/xylan/chitin deacetylase (PgdA/CDA1 family)